MDNTKLPAYPFLEYNEGGNGNAITIYSSDGYKQLLNYQPGFTKLELASLMIAQGFAANANIKDNINVIPKLSKSAVLFAKAVLEEANK